MTRVIGFGAVLLLVAAVTSCAIGFNQVFIADKGEDDARIILQGMKNAPLRPGDAPVDIQAE